ncbi:HNH endonuclease signature motif containing protein [Candidatus Poriferisocius sp.]|uniref:HNH endonuclease signature motif containing protein n=1 Tax=Candidatus Poriferisocius sp. TaxID=3101276 RepID=UPI003B020D8F
MLVRLGELEGNGWVEDVCEQFGRGRHAAHRQAKGTWLLKGLAATLDATAEGLVSVDHARLIGESNQRVSFTSAQEVEINCVGCRLRATACEVHHIAWWEQGGTTNINNLVLLCPNCHTKIHKHGYTLTTDPKGRHRLKPPPPHKPHSRNPGAPP